ncbi:MAG: hypothetical protein F2749_08490, partial [Actinobacteria bacterium]|nr:hypothetical protein [Actinomycetota bacterium]
MATWGQPNRRSKTKPQAAPTARTTTRPETAELPRSRRDNASSELREAVEGREHEFWGIGLVAIGLLLGLGVYMGGHAGPVGRGVATVVGWFSGVGRYLVPVALVSAGVAFIKRGHNGHRWRLTLGWGLCVTAVLGVLHVARNPHGLKEMGKAGGWLGAMFG